MLYLVGLGLNHDGISKFGLETVKKCKKVYLENYTVDFPYSVKKLEEVIGKKIIEADRDFVEQLGFLDEAARQDVALLVYGSPLTATTHITILNEAQKSGIRCKIVHNASIFDAVAETGLQLYKFGKTTSMPAWTKSFTPESFMEIIKENQSIDAHSLVLIDIGLDIKDALKQFETAAKNQKVKINKMAVCSHLGMAKKRIYYNAISDLKTLRLVDKPYCFVIPGKMHFLEREIIEKFEKE